MDRHNLFSLIKCIANDESNISGPFFLTDYKVVLNIDLVGLYSFEAIIYDGMEEYILDANDMTDKEVKTLLYILQNLCLIDESDA